ncbi:hypothetical protein LR69_04003 [Geobacillus sp. BCO2]|nr:hypothetical protein LR69_04003 [Geobacillus sp. BCO2]
MIGVVIAEITLSSMWVTLFFICAALMIGFSEILSGIASMITEIVVFGGVSLIGMTGIGVFILGLSLRLKQVGAVTEVLLYYLLIFSGFFYLRMHCRQRFIFSTAFLLFLGPCKE